MDANERQQRRERIEKALKAFREFPNRDMGASVEAAAIAAGWEQPLPVEAELTTGKKLVDDYLANRLGCTAMAGRIDAAIAEVRRPAIAVGLIAEETPTPTEPADDIPDGCIHYAISPFKAWCGADKPNLKTSAFPGSITCGRCNEMIRRESTRPTPPKPAPPGDDDSYVSVPPKPREPKSKPAPSTITIHKCECGGEMLPWQRGMVYRDCPDPDKVTLRCMKCGTEKPFRGELKPAPVPAVIETPEEVAERVTRPIAGGENYFQLGYWDNAMGLGMPLLVTARQVIARIIRERDAAHAAQLAQAREAALDEVIANFEAMNCPAAAIEVSRLKARPVAAGGK